MSIFLLIAGTYTPFTLGVLSGVWGWSIFAVVWGLAAVGMILKLLEKKPHPNFFTGLYLLMGWVMIAAVNPMIENVPVAGLLWLLAGGLFYSFGVIFFVLDSRFKFAHLIWHLFVIAGTTCHYFAVYGYAV
jgi:hemolysin III